MAGVPDLNLEVAAWKEALLRSPGPLTLRLPGGEPVEAEFDDIEDVAEGNVVASGRIAGEPESAISIVVNGDVVIATIRRAERAGKSLHVQADGGRVRVRELRDESGEESCGAVPAELADPAGAFEMSLWAAQRSEFSPRIAPTMDILAAYTPQARMRAGGSGAIVALIQTGIADTNRALADSGANLRVRLVGTMETQQNETGDFSGDLDRLRGTADGQWDEIHRRRQRLGADQVSLVGVYAGAKSVGGIGYINSTRATAFSIVKVSNFGTYTFTHEIGHNLGLHHADGFVTPRFRTIIAYGSSPRIRRFSNPLLAYDGTPTGTSDNNEVRIINRNAARLASFL